MKVEHQNGLTLGAQDARKGVDLMQGQLKSYLALTPTNNATSTETDKARNSQKNQTWGFWHRTRQLPTDVLQNPCIYSRPGTLFDSRSD